MENEETVPVEPTPIVEKFNIHVAIKAAIEEATPKIKDAVVEMYASKEIDKRRQALISAIDKLESARQEVSKTKPDANVYSEEGTLISKGYKKETLDLLTQKKELVAKITKAIDTALVNNDYSLVLKLNN